MKKAAFIVFVLLMAVCCAAFTACLYPSSLHKVDYDKLELIWQDEFDTFNTEYWHSEDDGVRRGANSILTPRLFYAIMSLLGEIMMSFFIIFRFPI